MGKNREFSLTEFLLDPRLSETPSEEHVKKWLEYRKEVSGIQDPDGTPEAFEFYEYLWKTTDRTNKSASNRGTVHTNAGEVRIGGDWMCSVWTTLRLGLKILDSQTLEEAGIANGRPTNLSCLQNGKLLENFDRFTLLKEECVHAFIYNAYTRANLIIVPAGTDQDRGMNSDRGCSRRIEDYWDKTMECVLPPEKPGGPLLKYAPDFKKLLDHFGIDGLCLGDWIEKGNVMTPRPLPSKNPTTFEDWKKLVEAMTCRIKNRRETMKKYIETLNHQ